MPVLAALAIVISTGHGVRSAGPQAPACLPQFSVAAPGRNLPHAFYDQAIASLHAEHPGLVVIARRRFATIGSVNFAVVLYRESAASQRVLLTGIAVNFDNEHAWGFEANCPAELANDVLIATMQALARLVAPISRPLSAEALERGQFVVFTLLWQVAVPGGDPIVFLPGGTMVNARGGLEGRWSIVDDTTLAIGDRRFRLRQQEGDLVSPLQAGSSTRGTTYWIERSGAVPAESRPR